MNRFSFSRQPSVWIGLVAAVLVVLTTVGVDVPPGLQAAIDGLIVALGAAVTWTQVRPAKQSVEVPHGADVTVYEPAHAPGVTKTTDYRLIEGQVRQIGASVTANVVPDVPVKAHPAAKKAAKKKPGGR